MEILLTDIIISFLPFMIIIMISGIVNFIYNQVSYRVNLRKADRQKRFEEIMKRSAEEYEAFKQLQKRLR